MSIMTGIDGNSLTAKTFTMTIKDLAESFDQVFICTSNRSTQIGLMALLEFAPSLVIITGARLRSPTLKT